MGMKVRIGGDARELIYYTGSILLFVETDNLKINSEYLVRNQKATNSRIKDKLFMHLYP